MLVDTDARRAHRLQEIEYQKAREAGRSASRVSVSIADLVDAGRAMKKRQEKSGKQTWFTWEPSDALLRLLTCHTAMDTVLVRDRVLSFCAECDADKGLRSAALAQGIDPDQWREWLDYAC